MASSMLALVRSNHHGHGSDVPWQFIVGYVTIGLIGWLITAILFVRHEQAKTDKPADADDKVMAVMTGMITFVGWPLVIVAVGVWKAIGTFTRQPVNMTKSRR